MNKIDKKSIKVMNLEELQTYLMFLIPILTLLTFKNTYEQFYGVFEGVIILLFFFSIKFAISIIENYLLYKNSNYTLNSEFLLNEKNGITFSESTIPLKRVQHVDIEQTFYSRLYNLYRVNIYTAGDSHNISYVNKEEAEAIKDRISSFVIEMSKDNE
jgi:membrane protein YdbS with pleckstrin-like domain